MIGAHAIGIIGSYKDVNKLPAKCMVCGQYSECQIRKYEQAIHIFFIEVKILEERFLFDWEECGHRAILFDKQDISRYKQEQIETGSLSVPYYQSMQLLMMPIPKRMPVWQLVLIIVLVLTASVAVGILISNILDRLGIPFVI